MATNRLTAIMALMCATGSLSYTKPGDIHTDPQILKQQKDFNKKKMKERMGLKEFNFNGTVILALNYKNAVKKLNKLKSK